METLHKLSRRSRRSGIEVLNVVKIGCCFTSWNVRCLYTRLCCIWYFLMFFVMMKSLRNKSGMTWHVFLCREWTWTLCVPFMAKYPKELYKTSKFVETGSWQPCCEHSTGKHSQLRAKFGYFLKHLTHRIHGTNGIWIPTWRVDFYGKCRLIHASGMGSSRKSWVLLPSVDICEVALFTVVSQHQHPFSPSWAFWSSLSSEMKWKL